MTDTSNEQRRDRGPERGAARRDPRVLMLGMGWFPATLGRANRYYRALFEQLGGRPRGGHRPGRRRARRGSGGGRARRRPLARRIARLPARGRARARAGGASCSTPTSPSTPLPRCCSAAAGGRPQRVPLPGAVGGRERRRGRQLAPAPPPAGGASSARVHARIDAHVVLSSAFRRVLVERYRVRSLERARAGPRRATRALHARATASRRASGSGSPAGGVRGGLHRAGWSRGWASTCCSTPGASSTAELPPGSALLLIGDGPLREQLGERAAAAAAGRPRARARPRLRRRADRRLPRGRRGGRADVALEGYRAGRAGGGRLRHPERRQRRRRPGRGGARAGPARWSWRRRRGRAGRRACGRPRQARSRPRAARASFAERYSLGGGGRPPPRAVPRRCSAGAARRRAEGRVPRPRRAPVWRGDRADAPAAPHAGASTCT